MSHLGVILVVVFIYLILTTFIGIWSVKYAKTTSNFMVAKNMMGPTLIGILLMSDFIGTGAFLGTAQTAYSQGMFASMSYISVGIGYFLYAFFMAPKFNATGEYTISGILQQKYGKGARWSVSIVMIYALLSVSVENYTGGAVAIASLLSVSVKTASLILAVLVSAVVATGGLRGIGFSNVIHILIKYIALIIIGVQAWLLLQHHPAAFARIPAKLYSVQGTGVLQLFTWTVANIGAVFSTQYIIQSISSLKDKRESMKASLIASIAIIPVGLIGAYAGVAARGLYPHINSVNAVPSIMNTMSPVQEAIVTCGVLGAAFVALSACLIGATTLIIKDFYVPLVKPSDSHTLRAIRITAVVLGLITLPFAWYVPAILKLQFFSRALRASIGVIAIFAFYLPNLGKGKGVVWGLICTIIGTSIWYILGNPFGIDNLYLAVGIPIIAMFVDSIITRLFRNKNSATTQTSV